MYLSVSQQYVYASMSTLLSELFA